MGTDLQDETLDPLGATGGGLPPPPSSPRVEILFHSDLSRIGEQFTLGNTPVTFGRDAPLFSSRSSSKRPLLDPCVSRRQLSIEWNRARRRFRVTPDPSARRSLSFFSPEGEPRARGDELQPGSLLAIGDRVLLRLELGADQDEDDLGILGHNASVVALRRTIRALANAPTSVLIRGETGVGKELVAQALHKSSTRAKAPFVAINCAALPENLVESELFGHVRGAFSGATSAKDGLFRAAGAGTVFLDEIGELSPTVQAKLLRALQERAVRPLGDAREIPFEAKVVCATHRDLARDVEEGRFRADLFARIESPEIRVAPLRERPSDVPLLFAHFLAALSEGGASSLTAGWFRAATVDPPPVPLELVLQLLRHPWPRNVRELQRWVVALAAASQEAGALRAPPLPRPSLAPEAPRPSLAPEAPPPSSPGAPPSAPGAPPSSSSNRGPGSEPGKGERTRGRPDVGELLRVLDAHDYVQHQVARTLGVSRTTLDKWMRELGVRRPKDVPEPELAAAYQAAGGDVEAAARVLRVSARGLQLRMTELGLLKNAR